MFKRLLSTATLAAAGLAVATAPIAAADTQQHAHLRKDGAVWLYKAGGGICKISTSRNLTGSTCLNADIVRIENHGYTDGVAGKVNARLYYNQSWQNGGRSAYACISPQDVWQRASGGVRVHFDQLDPAGASTAGTGLNLPVWHDVARVQWTSARCV